jgi:mono/diheme cytochrome c family protein
MNLSVHALSSAAALSVSGAVSARAEAVSYFDDIKPLLAVHCQKCHGPETQKSGMRLDVAATVFRGGESGKPAIVPAASDRSELMRRISSHDKDDQMPPKGPRLTDAEVARVKQWIDEGAKWPARDDYWAFQPPREIVPPPGTAMNPVDRFLDAQLTAKGIAPVPPADARTLLRRAFFDLLGVPPSPEEAALFLNDHTPDAYTKLVDRLLTDPRYGERWARHWLDLVRYGESDGYEDDKVRPLAWRYRDYVVRAFNTDKPYDRFVQEQLAGDELWPGDPDAWTATGFARLGAWDGMSKDPAKQRQDFLNDATDATGAVFLGMTLGCARCHDHKYDSITQHDYYAVQAFFAGLRRETREMKAPLAEPESVTAAYQSENEELTKLKSDREGLLKTARETLEKERGPEGKKASDDEVRKRAEKEPPGRLGKLDSAIKSLESRARFHAPRMEVVLQDGGSRKIRLLKGGELSRPGEEVAPGFVAAMLPDGAAPANDGKRASLARWLTLPGHPLTARVIVNRVWQHHFDTGLVATPSDFGHNGKRPTHPELLDWLACEFVRGGWSLKKLHRLIITSDAWRRASSPDATALSRDPDNKLLWRMNRRRLEGEAIRDTLLSVSGALNPAMGGPGVYAKLPAGINVEFPNNDKELSWGTATDADNRRRSLYLFQRRTLTYPLMEVFDSAPMNQSCAARAQTTVAPQALALFNGEFARECAAHFAARLQSEAGDDAALKVECAFQLAFTRPPGDTERAASLDFLRKQTIVRNGDGSSALTDFCHTLLNTSELIHPD